MNAQVITFKTMETEGKGFLSFFEAMHDIPFEIERVYYIYECPENVQRGGHAHRTLDQLLFCPYGSIEIILDDTSNKTSVMLDSPSKGLIIRGPVWRDMIWKKKDSVLVVAASSYYDESDYIRDYRDFVQYVNEGFLKETK